eukprot:10657286-Lingulodinium_polyedra.AAC.1
MEDNCVRRFPGRPFPSKGRRSVAEVPPQQGFCQRRVAGVGRPYVPSTLPKDAFNLNRVFDYAPSVTDEAYALPRGLPEEPSPSSLGARGAVSLDPGSSGPFGK